MAKVTKEHILTAHEKGTNDSDLAILCGVTKQAVYAMRKKYFPNGLPPKVQQP